MKKSNVIKILSLPLLAAVLGICLVIGAINSATVFEIPIAFGEDTESDAGTGDDSSTGGDDGLSGDVDQCSDSCKFTIDYGTTITPTCATDPNLCVNTCGTYYQDHYENCAPGQTGGPAHYSIPHDSCTHQQNGPWIVVSNTCTTPPSCTPLSESTTNACAAGETGTGRDYVRNGDTCSGWGPWVEVANRCTSTVVCTPVQTFISYPCNAGETGSGRKWESWGNTCNPGAWTDPVLIENTCTTPPSCTPLSESTTNACAAGETGTGRDYVRNGDTCSGWGPWVEVANRCTSTPICVPTDTSYSYTTSCPATHFGAGKTWWVTSNSCDGYISQTLTNDNCTPLPTIDLNAIAPVVGVGKSAGLYWTVSAPYAMNCTLMGSGGLTTKYDFNHTASVDTVVTDNNPYTGPLTKITSAQYFTLTCTAPSYPAMPEQKDTVRVEVVGISQEI